MAIYAIGDVHGCLVPLRRIFEEGPITPGDTVVFLGDYTYRGPDSKGVFDWFLAQRERYDFHFLMGNHDLMMLRARNSGDWLLRWLRSGGADTLASYGIVDAEEEENWPARIDKAHWDLLEGGLPYLQLGRFVFVHGGLEPGLPLERQDEHHLYWKKYEVPEAFAPGVAVICGHTSRKSGEIADFGHTVCIDTYAYGGQWLTCLDVESGDWVQANNEGALRRGRLKRP